MTYRSLAAAFVLVACLVGGSALSGHKKSDDDIFVVTSHRANVANVEAAYTKLSYAKYCVSHPTDHACRIDIVPTPDMWFFETPTTLVGNAKNQALAFFDTRVHAAELTTTAALVLPVATRSGAFTSPWVTLAPNVLDYGVSFQIPDAQLLAGVHMTAWIEEAPGGDTGAATGTLECGFNLDIASAPAGSEVFIECSNSGTGFPVRGVLYTCVQAVGVPLSCTPQSLDVGVTVQSRQ